MSTCSIPVPIKVSNKETIVLVSKTFLINHLQICNQLLFINRFVSLEEIAYDHEGGKTEDYSLKAVKSYNYLSVTCF